MLIDVEYVPRGKYLRCARKRNQVYCGIVKRPSDGFTCLAVRNENSSHRHLIQIDNVYAVIIGGVRHILETPDGHWRLNAQEVSKLVTGKFTEDWAAEYFDPASPKYFKAQPGYERFYDPEFEEELGYIKPNSRAATARRENPDDDSFVVLYGAFAMLLIWYFFF